MPPKTQGARRALALFLGAILLGATGALPIPVALTAGGVAMVLSGVLHIRQAYEAIDWSIIILLAALIPLGEALQINGATAIAGNGIIALTADQVPLVTLALLMIMTATLTNVLNNAATAVLMAPLAVHLAVQLGVSPDPMLMGVAVSASCAFLTPIGHQNNALVMGPGGYKFGDYWRLGLPLTVVVLAAALPMIVWVWPF
ncbi:MAG: SLC13 family permease [Alphaproteobacteria bacterium]